MGMIELIAREGLGGHEGPGIVIRDHFRRRPGEAGRAAQGLGPLVVLAETAIAPEAGFPMHAHAGVEIVSYVLTGALAHADTMGNGATLGPGDVQVMRCGTGVRHSEVNAGSDPVRMYQIWLAARRPAVEPGYVDLARPKAGADGLVALASGRPGVDGLAAIDVDAAVLVGDLAAGGEARHRLGPGRAAYVVVAAGAASVNGTTVGDGDAARVEGEEVALRATRDADVLLLDVAL